jgi:hypothetical protein
MATTSVSKDRFTMWPTALVRLHRLGSTGFVHEARQIPQAPTPLRLAN